MDSEGREIAWAPTDRNNFVAVITILQILFSVIHARRRRVVMMMMRCAHHHRRHVQQNQEAVGNIYCNLQYHSPYITKIMNGDWQATKEHLRVAPNSFRELVRKLNIHERHGWNAELKVMVFLFWLASGTSYRIVCVAFSLPRTTVFDMCANVLQCMMQKMVQIIRLPREEEELQAIGQGFVRKAGSAVFSQCVGAIDCTQIRIIYRRIHHNKYVNRRVLYSLNVQALVDHSGMFINMFCGFPGSVHNSQILRQSTIFRHSRYPPKGYYIIGGSGYPCRLSPVSLITPYKPPLNASKRSFNDALGKARTVVENAFRSMKVRWHSVFTKSLEVKVQKAAKVVIACSMIHNICISQGDIITMEEISPPEPPCEQNVRDEWDGELHRDAILALFLAERK